MFAKFGKYSSFVGILAFANKGMIDCSQEVFC